MNYSVPMIARLSDFDFLRSAFPSESKDAKEVVLTDDEIRQLLAIKVGSTSLLSSTTPGIVYDVISMIRTLGFSQTVTDLKSLISSGTITENNYTRFLVFESKIFEKQQVDFNKDLNKMQQRPEPVVGLIACPKCKSKNTVTDYLQTRRADEGYTFIIICNNCGARSRL